MRAHKRGLSISILQTTELKYLRDIAGYSYIAKWECGQVYAYKGRPEKVVRDGDWLLLGESRKCIMPYDFIGWDDNEPLCLKDLSLNLELIKNICCED